eukprot:scaffold22774_cov55-Attheya_sp.AAC.7
MPIRVTLRVKRASPLVHERHPIVKKQRTTRVPGIPNITDGSKACDSIESKSALCEPSYDPHLLHKTSTSSSHQITSQLGTVDHAEICSFSSRIETGLDDLSNQESEMNNGLSELQCEEDFENNIQVAPSSTTHVPAAIPFVLNKNKNTKYSSWAERFKELVDFKKINGHTNVPQLFGPLGTWVRYQRMQYRFLKEGKHSRLTSDKRDTLESIGFEFKAPPRWDAQFEELVDFKKINGHTNVPQSSGPLGQWVNTQRRSFCLLKQGKHSPLTSDRREKLESIGFVSLCSPKSWTFKGGVETNLYSLSNQDSESHPLNNACSEHQLEEDFENNIQLAPSSTTHVPAAIPFVLNKNMNTKFSSWAERFKELVDFKKINGHVNVPKISGPLGTWVSYQRVQYRLLKEGKDSRLTSDKRKKLESIGFEFKRHPSWDQRFQELVDFKKVNGYTNVPLPVGSGLLSGSLGIWVKNQQRRIVGEDLGLISDKRKKLESIGFIFKIRKK